MAVSFARTLRAAAAEVRDEIRNEMASDQQLRPDGIPVIVLATWTGLSVLTAAQTAPGTQQTTPTSGIQQATPSASSVGGEWRAYSADKGSSRYSPLDQIVRTLRAPPSRGQAGQAGDPTGRRGVRAPLGR